MTKQDIIKFKQNVVQCSTEEAKKILMKEGPVNFDDMQERDELLTYKRLIEEDLKRLKEK